MKQNDETTQSRSILIGTAVIIIGIVGSYFLLPGVQSFIDKAWSVLTSGNDQRISQWIKQFGFWGPVFIAALTTAQMFLLIVNITLLVLVAILAYGPIWGSLIGIASICIASTIGYFIGRALGRQTVHKLIGTSTEQKITQFMEDYGSAAVVIARISPFLSNDAISFVAGILRMSYFKFMAATLAGIIPLVALIAWMSESMERLKSGLIWVSAISLLGFIGYVVYDKYFKKG